MMNFIIGIYTIKLMLQKQKNKSKAKVVVGASGTWQYNYDPAKIEEYGLYAIMEGDLRWNRP